MLVGAPGLHRAVAECTQPHGPPAGAEVSKTLEKYLSDVKCTDTVYKALLNRASIEPKSEVVVQKVVGVLKQFVSRYLPSREVLGLIEDFCTNIALGLPPTAAGLKKSLGYVKATITLLRGSSGGKQQASGSGSSRPDASPARSVSGFGGAEGGDSDGGGGADLKRSRSLYMMTSVENGQAAPAASDVNSLDFVPSSVNRLTVNKNPKDDRPRLSSPPDWAIPANVFRPSPTLATRPSHLRAWAQLLPQYHHSLQLLLTRPEGGVGEMDVANSHDTLWDLTGQDPDELMQHLEELTVLSHKGAHPVSERKQKPNMFFCTQPYSQAERLVVESPLVEAAIEAVLGVVPAPSTVCTEDNPQASPTAGVWNASKVHLWEPRGNLPSVGQMCFGILLKLIMDMYVQNGPLLSFPLAHRMLAQGLRNSSPEVRSRVFGVLYNLAIHSIGFEPPTLDPVPAQPDSPPYPSPGGPYPSPGGLTPQLRPGDGGAGGAGSWRIPHSSGAAGATYYSTPPASPAPLLQPSPSPSGFQATRAPSTPQQAAAASAEREGGAVGHRSGQLQRWLLMLLYQMLADLAEMEESTEEVWQAALGCVLFLSTQSGCFVKAAVEPFPMDVLSQLLRACLHFGWSMELYCHLLHLTCYLLTCAPTEGVEAHRLDGWCHLDPARLESFGGAEEVLFHFCEAPTHHARKETLCVLLLAVKPEEISDPEADAMREMLCSYRPLPDILQVALRSPLPGLAERIYSAIRDLIKHVPSSARELLDRLEQLAVGFLDTSIAGEVEENMADVVSQGGPDGLYRAWQVLAEVVEIGGSSGSKLAAYCLTRLVQANSQDLQDTLLPSPHSSANGAEAGALHTQHPKEQIIQVIRALLQECADGVAIFVDMVCQLILSFKEEALSSELPEAGGAGQPLPSSESGKVLIARLIVNTWTAAMEWLLTCSSVPPSVLYRVSDMVLATLTCLPGNPPPPILQDTSSLPTLHERLTTYRNGDKDKESEISWESLDRLILPQLVLQGHLPFYIPCLLLVPLQCLVLLLQSFPAEQTCIQRLLLGRPGTSANVGNPLSVPWLDSFSSSRMALLLALVCANAHSPIMTHLIEALQPLMECNDVQVRHLISVQILKHWFQYNSNDYWQELQQLLLKAQQQDNEKMLLNPYLQVSSILKMQAEKAAA